MSDLGDQWLRVTRALFEGAEGDLSPTRICIGAATLLGVAGAGIALMGEEGALLASYTSSARFELLEQTQLTLGVGPAVDAFQQGVPVLEPDLVTAAPAGWFALPQIALDSGVLAMFSFPLIIGEETIGALTWYQDKVGPLSDDQNEDAVVAAEVTTYAVLSLQAGMNSGQAGVELAEEDLVQEEVHQAVGMISFQLGIGVGEAMSRLRAWAFANNVPIVEVAERILRRELRLEA